jgi:A/G-specific adenine glycosylase
MTSASPSPKRAARGKGKGKASDFRPVASARIGDVRARLLSFYDSHKRDLPWRGHGDPYATWVSEIMLQQTRVDTVIPYYRAFMRRFPTVLALAEASSDDVLSAWSGLGYYRRARMLHEGAKTVAREYGGKVPHDADALLGLPGVGRYTAGAIASIAFGQEAPLVDGNVVRVVARVFGLDRAVGPQDDEVWALAQALVRGPRPGDLNQALMEQGATICTKDSPSCDGCGLATRCEAFASKKQKVWPILAAKKPPRKVLMEALVVSRGNERLLCRRREAGLFGGLWEPPMLEVQKAQSSSDAFTALLGCELHVGKVIDEVRHVLTHRDLSVTVRAARLGARATPRCVAPYEAARFVDEEALDGLGVSRLSRKLLGNWGTADA